MNLSEIVEKALDEAGGVIDFDVITDKVITSIPSDEIDETLRMLLRPYITDHARFMRRRLLDPNRTALTEAMFDSCDDTPSPAPGRSRRERYVHAWLKVLDAIVIIEEGKPGKRLGACSLGDVMCLEAGAARREAEMHARKLQYRFLAESMNTAKAKKVEDLPPAVLEAFVKGGKP